MKRVVLIGDSIRMGYERTVGEELSGVAEVLSPKENVRNSRTVLAHIEEWALVHDPECCSPQLWAV